MAQLLSIYSGPSQGACRTTASRLTSGKASGGISAPRVKPGNLIFEQPPVRRNSRAGHSPWCCFLLQLTRGLECLQESARQPDAIHYQNPCRPYSRPVGQCQTGFAGRGDHQRPVPNCFGSTENRTGYRIANWNFRWRLRRRRKKFDVSSGVHKCGCGKFRKSGRLPLHPDQPLAAAALNSSSRSGI